MADGTQFVPRGIEAIAKEMRELRREVDSLRRQLAVNQLVDPDGNLISDNGRSIIVRGGGGIRVLNPQTGLSAFYVGSQPNSNAVPPDQMAWGVWREDGSQAIGMADLGTVPGHAQAQALQMFDRAGNVVLADDTIGGIGLAAPHVYGTGGPVADTNTSGWPSTTAGSWTTIADGYWRVQNPRLAWTISCQADASTTGEFRLTWGGTSVVLATGPTVTGTFSTWSVGNAALPVGSDSDYNDVTYVALQAQRTSGAGTIRAICKRWEGDQSP